MKERKRKEKERDEMKGIRGYLKVPPLFPIVVSNNVMQ